MSFIPYVPMSALSLYERRVLEGTVMSIERGTRHRNPTPVAWEEVELDLEVLRGFILEFPPPLEQTEDEMEICWLYAATTKWLNETARTLLCLED